MNPLLFFFIPPLIGAFIGYSTNIVAIRMLFRPLREIRILGIRLPFTPGILPGQRHKLAQSIGSMVERELLTAEIIKARLSREEVRSLIKHSLSLFTSNLLSKQPGELFGGNENLLSERISDAAGKIYPSITAVFADFLNKQEVRQELEARGRVLLQNILLKLSVLQRLFISAGQYDVTLEQKMPEIIDELIKNTQEIMQDPKVKNFFLNSVTSLIGQNKNIKSILNLNENDKNKFDDFLFDKLMTTADKQIESVLSSINIKTLVSERIDSLDMLRVERIILDVMSDQFKWIEIFGGILGFLIGLFQSSFVAFMR